MMGLPAIKLDTLSVVRELEREGVPKLQAEAQVRATVKVVNMVIEEKLVTKQDLVESQKQVFSAISELDKRISKLEQRIETLELKLTVRLGSIMVAGMIVLGTILKF